MKPCEAFMPGGINPNCIADLGEVKNIFICDASVSFSSLSDILNLATWKTKVQQGLSIYVPKGVNDYEVTTDDPNIVTLQSTRKTITNNPLPSATVMFASNFCDYKEILGTLNGGNYGVIYELSDGSLLATKTTAGVYKPLSANLWAISKGIPLKGDVGNNFMAHVFHSNVAEFKNAVLISPAWDATFELSSVMPVGLGVSAAGVYDTAGDGDIEVVISERCGDGYDGLLVASFEVVESNDLDTPAVASVTDNGNGSYTVELQKGAVPANLDSGDYIMFRVKKVTGSNVDYLSSRLTVIAP